MAWSSRGSDVIVVPPALYYPTFSLWIIPREGHLSRNREHRMRRCAMPSVNGLLESALYVEDLPRSAQFYQALFGFAPLVVSDRLVALAVRDGQVLLLFKKRASLQLRPGAHDGDGQLHLAFAVDAG